MPAILARRLWQPGARLHARPSVVAGSGCRQKVDSDPCFFIRGFRDEALSGDWKGHRSSRLNEQWRVIYSVEADVMIVQVVRVTPHDYRKR